MLHVQHPLAHSLLSSVTRLRCRGCRRPQPPGGASVSSTRPHRPDIESTPSRRAAQPARCAPRVADATPSQHAGAGLAGEQAPAVVLHACARASKQRQCSKRKHAHFKRATGRQQDVPPESFRRLGASWLFAPHGRRPGRMRQQAACKPAPRRHTACSGASCNVAFACCVLRTEHAEVLS